MLQALLGGGGVQRVRGGGGGGERGVRSIGQGYATRECAPSFSFDKHSSDLTKVYYSRCQLVQVCTHGDLQFL